MKLKGLPLGIQTFRKIINGDYIYADKTEFIYKLINNANYYFLSRPRRFGKSLLIDTIAEVFSGDKELFKGLYIYESDYGFDKHPVVRFDMSNISNKTPEVLEISLSKALQKRVRDENLDIVSEPTIQGDMFKYLIEALFQKYDKQVVVLIDEYDKPILDHLHNPEIAEANRQVLRGFYGILKSMDRYLRMTFITGVSKFTKTSIFSELNNLFDITMTRDYANICGIPVDELSKHFGAHIRDIEANRDDYEEFKHISSIHDSILSWYDGYSWDGKTRLLNPFSLLTFFSQKRFSSFWYASGTPTFLIKMLKQRPELIKSVESADIRERSLDSFDINRMSMAPLLFQTGYLTVDKIIYGEIPVTYLLKIPNFEVREAFYLNILSEFVETDDDIADTAFRRIKASLKAGTLDNVLGILRGLFASIPYELHVKKEAYYHSIFFAILNLLGFDVDAEVSVSRGRIDAVLELDDKVYIIEFKYVDCAQDVTMEAKLELFNNALDEGIAQIESKEYTGKYEGTGKTIYKAAFAFLGRDDIEMRVV